MKIIPGDIKTGALHGHLLSIVAPRPICFASTIDEEGNPNLSPFSFFNVFGSKPPILVFSPARRVRNNTIKHTLENAMSTKEVVVNVVSYDIVQQMNLASCEYGDDINEFTKSGLTPVKSDIVKPFRVKESPAQLECKVLNVVETGSEGGAGNLIVCEILCVHINDDVLDEDGTVNPHKIDLVARMGKNYYCRASGSSVFEVAKPNIELGIGVDSLPDSIRNSDILTGNDLGILGNYTSIPEKQISFSDERLLEILKNNSNHNNIDNNAIHQYARELINTGNTDKAWQVLLHNS